MKRIGVLTFHDVPNFGAILQAWSVIRLLEQLGCRAELINYKPNSLIAKFRRTGLKRFIPSYGTIRRKSFIRRHLLVGPLCRNQEVVRQYVKDSGFHTLICGSDQIWMMDDSMGFDSTFLLDIADGKQVSKVSYAPSCGSMSDFGLNSQRAKELLSDFHAISVRDKHTGSVLSDIGIQKYVEVVDPTLLADFSPFITDRLRVKEPYLAIVGPCNQKMEQAARQIASHLNLRLLALGTRVKCSDIEKRFVNPGEWANYISKAEFVVTSLFHGVMLSLKFRRNFLASPAPGREQKISDILERFGLSGRLQKSNGDFEINPTDLSVDYSGAHGRIDEATKISWQFLSDAIRG